MQQLQQDEIIRKKYLARGPGDAATKAYIASKYLDDTDVTKKKKKKKKKKTHTVESSKKRIGNIGIVDEEDDFGWSQPKPEEDNSMSFIEDDKAQQVIASDHAFRGSTSNWETVRPDIQEDYVSDEDERPLIVQEEQEDFNSAPRMSNGQRAGILTKEQIKAEAERARQAEQMAMAKLKQESQATGGEDTVYRDASGRKVDLKRQRAEEMRLRQEQIDREARKMEWGKGLVQRREAEEKKRQLEEAKDMPMARYADDEQLNQELKDRERWNDPAAGFLTKKSDSKSKGSRLVKPTYKGAWKPNRFMIAPGYRWDGVDRSTGYEDQLLLQINQAKSQAAQAHEWSTEDM